jgi:hypothetical protein
VIVPLEYFDAQRLSSGVLRGFIAQRPCGLPG